MKVLVTGGTGFVGSHSVKAIADDGHDLRLLVRSPGRLAPALEPPRPLRRRRQESARLWWEPLGRGRRSRGPG
jgi:nucleoside-diphosphate-sugar epimerase